jgi:hypothetical protein
MSKISVKLVNAQNVFNDDKGKRIPPYVSVKVEDSQRIQDAIKINLLERVKDGNEPELEPEIELPAGKPEEKK